MGRREAPVVVVGGGISGLVAAREISRAGHRVTILEARSRLGGRIHTLNDPGWLLPVELGAEFIHGEGKETGALIREAGGAVLRITGGHYAARGHRLVSAGNFWSQIERTSRSLERRFKTRSADVSVEDYLRASRMPEGRCRLFREYVEGFQAAHPRRISARSLAGTGSEASDRQGRPASGYGAVVAHLRDSLLAGPVDLRLATPVERIEWRPGEVILHPLAGDGAAAVFRARAAIIAVPHAVLKASGILFDPELADRQQAAGKLEVGQVFKIILRFRNAFWEKDDFLERRIRKHSADGGDPAFFHAVSEAVPVWWTSFPLEAPLLTGWAGGPRAERMLALGPDPQIDRSIDCLSRILAVPRRLLERELVSSRMHDWSREAWSLGAYSYIGVGGMAAPALLARPVERTLFFCGDFLDPDSMGTVEGAISGGLRAARQALERLGTRAAS